VVEASVQKEPEETVEEPEEASKIAGAETVNV
jgi:hypothetical protein